MIWIAVFCIPFLVILVGLALRPIYIHRGMTSEEWNKTWPGDECIPGAKPSGSRAIVIDAPASEVWKWITQIGQDRAGFYSYQWLENLVGSNMPDVKETRKAWSSREIGQQLIMAPPKKFGKIATMDIVNVDPGHFFVAQNAEGTWAFIAEPISASTCRFVARGTWLPSPNLLARVAHTIVFDPIHYIMEWKMVRKVKQLAEYQTATLHENCQQNP